MSTEYYLVDKRIVELKEYIKGTYVKDTIFIESLLNMIEDYKSEYGMLIATSGMSFVLKHMSYTLIESYLKTEQYVIENEYNEIIDTDAFSKIYFDKHRTSIDN